MSEHPRLALLWIVTCLVLLYPVVRAWHRPWEMLGLPFVCGLFGLYFYGFMAYQAARTLDDEIPLWSRELGHVVVIISALALFVGWYGAITKRTIQTATNRQGIAAYGAKLWMAGQLLAWLGVAGFIIWQRSGVGFETSAYVYMLPRLVFPGAALCVVAILSRPAARSLWKWTLALGPVVICVLPELLGARRGPVMAVALMLIVSITFGRRAVPARGVILGVLLAGGMLILAFLPMRRHLVEGSSFGQAFGRLTTEEVVASRTQQVADNEYAYHCGLVGTAYKTDMYQKGTKTLMLLLHWVPRSYWPDKPERGAGLYPSAKDEMPNVVGMDMGLGMSAAGFAHAFEDFGFLVVIFWLAFGWVTAKIYLRAISFSSPVWCIAWINIFSCAHWLFAQDFGAFFVPMLYAQVGAFGVLKLLGAEARLQRAPARQKKVPRRDSLRKASSSFGEVTAEPQARQAQSRDDN